MPHTYFKPSAEHMRAALVQAQMALDAGNLPIGAVIVHHDQIIASGMNAIDYPPDDTHHAELRAIQSIAPFLAAHKGECTIYTTLEPCMMCLGAIINVGIGSVVIAAADSYVGALNLLDGGDYYRMKSGKLQVERGFMAEESQALLNEYVRRTGGRAHLASVNASQFSSTSGDRPRRPDGCD